MTSSGLPAGLYTLVFAPAAHKSHGYWYLSYVYAGHSKRLRVIWDMVCCAGVWKLLISYHVQSNTISCRIPQTEHRRLSCCASPEGGHCECKRSPLKSMYTKWGGRKLRLWESSYASPQCPELEHALFAVTFLFSSLDSAALQLSLPPFSVP